MHNGRKKEARKGMWATDSMKGSREGAGQPRNVALSARPMSVQPATTDFCSMRSACLKVLCGLASVTASDQTDGLYGNNGI